MKIPNKQAIRRLLNSDSVDDNRIAFQLIARDIVEWDYIGFKKKVEKIMGFRSIKYFDGQYSTQRSELIWSFNRWARDLHTETYENGVKDQIP